MAIECCVDQCENKSAALYVAVFRMPYYNTKRTDKFELELDSTPLCAEHAAMVRPLVELPMDEWEYLVNKSLMEDDEFDDIPDRSKAKMIFRQVRPPRMGMQR